MLVHERAANKMTAYDGRETAPAAATPQMFLRDGEPMGFVDIWPAGISVGVPGTVSL